MTRPPSPEAPNLIDDAVEDAVARLYEALAILEAVEARELLSDLPHGHEAADRRQSAISLLAVLRRELQAIAGDLDAAQLVTGRLAKITRSQRSA
jgi:hypothetical protein